MPELDSFAMAESMSAGCAPSAMPTSTMRLISRRGLRVCVEQQHKHKNPAAGGAPQEHLFGVAQGRREEGGPWFFVCSRARLVCVERSAG